MEQRREHDRRHHDRRPYRLQVYFWERDSEKRSLGYTVNVSRSGMYITTNRVLARGTRIRTELRAGNGRGVMAEAVVARVERSLNQLRPDAMGVRFLTTKELLSEIVPELGSKPARHEESAPEGVYRLHFQDRQQFLAAFERDLSTGGLFVPSQEPATLNDVVTVEIRVAEAPPVRFQARVVHRAEPSGGNLMAGMGVELLNFEKTLVALRSLAADNSKRT